MLAYTILAGLFFPIPNVDIVDESVRNLFFHVPMWFGMTLMLLLGFVNAIAYLVTSKMVYDIRSKTFTQTALIFGMLGLVTGSLWALITWGHLWTNDPKLNGTAIGMLLYMAYFVLRNSLEEDIKRATVSSVYNILIFPIFFSLIYVLPRLFESLHPGNGGNPGFNIYDQAKHLRLVFYPAVIGWFLLGFWISNQLIRVKKIENELIEQEIIDINE
ncbi:MAG TPA: cytochrome c biogenesis protein CcsA [Cytophagales bacterium]|nr:cytochrome c biogenesis protein CcsA [Cytophagales bacterium]